MDTKMLFLLVAFAACGSSFACTLPNKPSQSEYVKYIMCLQAETGFTSDGGRWGRSVDGHHPSQALRKFRSKKTTCVLKQNPQQQDYISYVMCLQSNGYTTDGGRWGRSIDRELNRNSINENTKSKRAECVLKQNPQQQDMINYVICLQSNGFTTDGGRWGRSIDRELIRNGINEKTKSKRAECVLKQNPQQQDMINYVICLQSNGFTTDGGRWGRSVDRELSMNDIEERSKSKREDECLLKPNPQPQDIVSYVLCMQNNGYTADGGRFGRSADRPRHYRVMGKILQNIPDFSRWFHLSRDSPHEQAEIPSRQGGRDDNQDRVFSRQANGRVQDLASAGVTIIEHPVKRSLRDILTKSTST